MINQELIDYIIKCRALKISNEQIKTNLISIGWHNELINDAFHEIVSIESQKLPLVRINNIFKRYSPSKNITVAALNGISLEVYKGEFLSITGYSGSGKSTLLNLIGLIDEPDGGEIIFENEDIKGSKNRQLTQLRLFNIGFIFQFFNLLEDFTAIENVAFALRLQNVGFRKTKERAKEILEVLGLKDKMKRYPNELSGGEQQRVAIARALAKDPLLILADEPTAHLDFKNGQLLISLLREINVKFKKTIVLVSHEPSFAEQADRVVILMDGKLNDIKRLRL